MGYTEYNPAGLTCAVIHYNVLTLWENIFVLFWCIWLSCITNGWQLMKWLLQLNSSTNKTKKHLPSLTSAFPLNRTQSETSTVPYDSVMPVNTEWRKCQKWRWMSSVLVLEHSLTFDCKMRCFDLYYLTLTNCNCSIKIINTSFFFCLSVVHSKYTLLVTLETKWRK